MDEVSPLPVKKMKPKYPLPSFTGDVDWSLSKSIEVMPIAPPNSITIISTHVNHDV